MDIQKMLDRVEQQRQHDKQRFEESDDDLCMLCHAYGADKRNLLISCFYDVSEVVPEAISLHYVEAYAHTKGGWYLRICKSCRARLLGMLAEWRAACIDMRDVPKDSDGDPMDAMGTIPVRINGAVVMMSDEQYEEYQQRKDGGR